MARATIDVRASLSAVAAGGIPLRARERLADEAGPHKRLFTSDLGVAEFLLARDAGCEPISQVMGSSIFHVGQIPDYKGKTGEIEVIGDAHRESRRAALARLFEEAALLGADAVIGVHLRDRMITMGSRGKGGDDGGEVLEFTVVGTAVRAPWIQHPPNQPIITDLSGQDLWALHQDGFEPCGFLFEFVRYHVWHVTRDLVFGLGSGELELATSSVEEARRIAAAKLLVQAGRHQAEFVIGSDLDVSVREVPCGWGGCPLDDLDIDISWFGTGVRRIAGGQPRPHVVPPLLLAMMPIGRRADAAIDADDDADDVEIAAEEAEEAALEADEAASE
ncbi:MAG TPA: heavy metal-binding domain-containing protein [Kofleriaceae bacterium]|nr:heavy metal-binding domain-containing protein [Kofleriaceae bacterium]